MQRRKFRNMRPISLHTVDSSRSNGTSTCPMHRMLALALWASPLIYVAALSFLSTVISYSAHESGEPGFFVNERVPSLPLAVKSPYLSAWLPVGSGEGHLAGRWPQFWLGQVMGWTGFIRVDDITYTFMGTPNCYGQEVASQLFYKVGFTTPEGWRKE